MQKHTLLITGAAGYVGAMLVEQFSKRDDVERIIGLDKELRPEGVRDNGKLVFIQQNMADAGWEEQVRTYQPDIVVHTAWQIREMYGDRATEWHWNIDGSDRVFDFAFGTPSVKRLVHFSTVASYGAFADNSVDHFFTEDEPFRESKYLYAEEKRFAEEHLRQKYEEALQSGRKVPQVRIVRPAAITGPRGRYARVRFGLQAALSGSLKGRGSFFYDIISAMVSWVPVTPKWLRQYVHEDDVTDIVSLFSFDDNSGGYDAVNLAPPGDAVTGADMARAVGKRVLPIYPWMARIPFFFLWHLSRGRVPTAPGSWRGYCYPIAVSGEKLTYKYNFNYRCSSFDAFYYTNGRYEEVVPKELRRER